MTLYKIKPIFQAMLRPIMFGLYKHHISANFITVFSIILSFLTGGILIIFLLPNFFILLPIILFVRMALNALDGMLARECNQETHLGAILNEVGDIISDIVLYFPLILLPSCNIFLGLLMLFCIILTEFCGVLVQTINGKRNYDGPLGKSDRALIFGIWGFLLSIWPNLIQWSNIMWGVITILLLWTIINRCRSVL